jgi:hypothetical protein
VRTFTARVVVLIALVMLLRVGVVLAAHASDPSLAVTDDTRSYVDPARSLEEDGTFNHSPRSPVPEFGRTPGYPAFVAAIETVFGEGNTAILAVQTALSALSVLVAILIALRLSGSTVVALGAGALLAIDPAQTATGEIVGTEALSAVLFTVTAYAGVRFVQSNFAARWGVAYGVSLALATYVRPTPYYFVIVVVGILVVMGARHREWRRALVRGGAAFLLPCILLLGAWNVRNAVEIGSWRFSSIEAINLYWYRAADVIAEEKGIGFEEARTELTKRLSDGQVPAFEYERYKSGQLPPAWSSRQSEYYDRAYSAAIDILLDQPLATGRQFAQGIYSQVVQSGWQDAFASLGFKAVPQPIPAVGLIFVWGVEGLAVVGAVLSLRRGGVLFWAHVLTIGLPLYTIFVSAGAEAAAGSRFRIPIWPIIAVYAAIGVQHIVLYVRDRRRGAIRAAAQ